MRKFQKNKKVQISILVFIVGFILLFILFSNLDTVFALSKYGSRGEEVKQIQTKLKRWGYYNGSIDGIYGTKTLNAVKSFQRKNGLTVDGIAGTKTLNAMGINNTGNSTNIWRGKRRKLCWSSSSRCCDYE